jgi:large subunit ribosomal protein L35
MPKMKTLKSAVKRFKKTATGKIKRNKAFASHILKKKSSKRKRNYRRSVILAPADAKNVKKMI